MVNHTSKMSTIKKILILFNIIYIIIGVLFIFDIFTVLEIKGNSLKSFIHLGSLISIPLILILNLFLLKSKKWRIWAGSFSVLFIISFSIVIYQRGFLGYLFSTSSWNTQIILYENENSKFQKVEFQMQDIGALGYNNRYVRVTYLTPWFMLTEIINPENKMGEEWIRVDKNSNELEIMY